MHTLPCTPLESAIPNTLSITRILPYINPTSSKRTYNLHKLSPGENKQMDKFFKNLIHIKNEFMKKFDFDVVIFFVKIFNESMYRRVRSIEGFSVFLNIQYSINEFLNLPIKL